jgi:hypothetical protein
MKNTTGESRKSSSDVKRPHTDLIYSTFSRFHRAESSTGKFTLAPLSIIRDLNQYLRAPGFRADFTRMKTSCRDRHLHRGVTYSIQTMGGFMILILRLDPLHHCHIFAAKHLGQRMAKGHDILTLILGDILTDTLMKMKTPHRKMQKKEPESKLKN